MKLALQIAKNIVAKEIKLNNSVIKNIVRVALQETEVHGKIYLFLHPDDYEFLGDCKSDLERYLNDEQSLVLRQNPEMEPGSIYVESDDETISRSIDGQFDKLEESLTEQIENRHSHLAEVDIDAHNFSIEPLPDTAVVETDSLDSDETESEQKSASSNVIETSAKIVKPVIQVDQEVHDHEIESVESENH